MGNNFQLILLYVLYFMLSTSAMALDSDTRKIKRELMMLDGSIHLSAVNMSVLSHIKSAKGSLYDSDDATVLASLEYIESLKNEKEFSEFNVPAENVLSARKSIQRYDSLCLSIQDNAEVYSDYCKFRFYKTLHETYVKQVDEVR